MLDPVKYKKYPGEISALGRHGLYELFAQLRKARP